MKVTFKRESLLKLMAPVMSVVKTNSPKPILKNVKLTAGPDGLTIEATDIEIGIRVCDPSVTVLETGVALVPAQLLRSILAENKAEELTLVKESSAKVEIRGNRAAFKLPTAEEGEFPAISAMTSDKYHEVSAAAMGTLISQTSFAIDDESSRFALGGVLLEVHADHLIGVSTDGRRLSASKVPATAANGHSIVDRQVIVPEKALKVIQRVLADMGGAVCVTATNNELFVTGESFSVTARLLEGRFPSWKDIVPSNLEHAISVSRDELQSLVRQAVIFTNPESKGVDFTVTGAGELSVKSTAADVGEGNMSMIFAPDAGIHSDVVFEITLDGRYVLDFLNTCRSDVVKMEMKDSDTMVLFKDEDWRYVAMPMSRNG